MFLKFIDILVETCLVLLFTRKKPYSYILIGSLKAFSNQKVWCYQILRFYLRISMCLSILQNAQKVTMVKNVQRHAVTTVLEKDISVIMSLVLVTWVVVQDIRVIYVQKVRLSRLSNSLTVTRYLYQR